MKKKWYVFFTVLSLLALSCNFIYNLATPSQDKNQPGSGGAAQTEGFAAQSTAGGAIQLTWTPVNGAQKYLLELKDEEGNYLPLTLLDAATLSFEDVNVPENTRLTYRLTGMNQSGRLDSRELTLTTQPTAPDPLAVTPEYDMAPPQIDPANFDPNNFDPSQFDPNNFDPSVFVPQPVESQAVIGPDGGELTVTGSNGVIYTLTVPPGALNYETAISLQPISNIPDLPLSGGLMAAVLIEPETLVFEVPATLRMTPPSDFPAPAAPLTLAFAFGQDGQDFHLYPFDIGGELTQNIPHNASLLPSVQKIGPLADIAKARFGGGYGQGSGTVQDVRNISKKTPTRSAHRTAQRAALSQVDDLTPLPNIEEMAEIPNLPPEAAQFEKDGQRVQQHMEAADDLSSLREALEDFSIYINSGGAKYNKSLNKKILEILVDKLKTLLQKNKGECLTADDFLAQELVERLANPKDNFSKAMSARFKAKYGQTLLNDLIFGRKDCQFELSLKSNLTFEAFESTLFTDAQATKMKLFLQYAMGEIYLNGGGKMKLKMYVTGVCSFPLRQYDNLIFNVDKMYPVFEGKTLTDFSFSKYSVSGWEKKVSISGKDGKDCPGFVRLNGGGDYWSALFTVTRATFAEQFIRGWKISSTGKGAVGTGSLQAHWESVVVSFTPVGEPDAIMSEDTKLDLKVTATPKKK
ncbi:MAG: hypothetical protein OHK0041_21750 [Anaerolineales bacterium]